MFANPNLNLSGGVGGAFLMRYGNDMQEFLHDHLRATGQRGIEPGSVVIAPPCGSPFMAVANAVAIDVFYDTDALLIQQTYATAIRLLSAANCRTIVAACLGCGYGRCSPEEFLKAVRELVAIGFDRVDTVTLATTNADLAGAIGEIL